MDERHLDPDIHLWPECPEDVCLVCGNKFAADVEIEEDTPMFMGYCSTECEQKTS